MHNNWQMSHQSQLQQLFLIVIFVYTKNKKRSAEIGSSPSSMHYSSWLHPPTVEESLIPSMSTIYSVIMCKPFYYKDWRRPAEAPFYFAAKLRKCWKRKARSVHTHTSWFFVSKQKFLSTPCYFLCRASCNENQMGYVLTWSVDWISLHDWDLSNFKTKNESQHLCTVRRNSPFTQRCVIRPIIIKIYKSPNIFLKISHLDAGNPFVDKIYSSIIYAL